VDHRPAAWGSQEPRLFASGWACSTRMVINLECLNPTFRGLRWSRPTASFAYTGRDSPQVRVSGSRSGLADSSRSPPPEAVVARDVSAAVAARPEPPTVRASAQASTDKTRSSAAPTDLANARSRDMRSTPTVAQGIRDRLTRVGRWPNEWLRACRGQAKRRGSRRMTGKDNPSGAWRLIPARCRKEPGKRALRRSDAGHRTGPLRSRVDRWAARLAARAVRSSLTAPAPGRSARSVQGALPPPKARSQAEPGPADPHRQGSCQPRSLAPLRGRSERRDLEVPWRFAPGHRVRDPARRRAPAGRDSQQW
jgi:hypothetical protein